jgi:MoxR-like ATPase
MIQRHLATGTQICIGNICIPIWHPSEPENVPTGIFPTVYENQELLNHLQWIMKKDSLGQDMLLIGPPGAFKRRLALQYLALTQQEMEYVHIHPDTSSESDLKQRREITISSNGTQELKWMDGPCVRAAINGRCLVIEGIEKADRNVLPVLNNLLENREMTLEDGRHLISFTKYDSLLKENSLQQLNEWGLLRSHEKFRVIAIGCPVPPFPGKPLDPPFRSRFQARYIDIPSVSPPNLRLRNDFPASEILSDYVSAMNKVIQSIRITASMGIFFTEHRLRDFDSRKFTTCIQSNCS